MTAQGESSPAAVGARLRAVLESVAAALEHGRLDDLVAGEAALDSAVADIARLSREAPDARGAIRGDLAAARRALMRCRRLGFSLGEFTRASFEARGAAVGYDPARSVASAMTGRGFHTRA
jgi:hypothetical protein